MSLFSTLDDGTGFTPVESVIDAWMEEGIENSVEILQVTRAIMNLFLTCSYYFGLTVVDSFKLMPICRREKIRSPMNEPIIFLNISWELNWLILF